MKTWIKRAASFIVLLFLFAGQISVHAAVSQVNEVIKDTANYIYKTVKEPEVGSVGGEWAVIGLARSGYDMPDSYYQSYYRTVEAYVKAANGILHDKKYTEYSRVILALTAAGYDPTAVAGYDLTMALGDFEKTVWQGINGPVFALIALDSGNYAIPKKSDAAVQATRTMYVDEILRRQLSDGGFSLLGGIESAAGADDRADPDITAMALQALVNYQDRADVKKVMEEALACLSKLQDSQGGYASWNENNVESVAQVIVALTELGIPLDDPRFVKNGQTLVDNLLTFYVNGQGFCHAASGGESNLMATEQAFYALVAAQRAEEGKNSLYRMKDRVQSTAPPQENIGTGLPGKDAAVKALAVTYPGKTFDDIGSHAARAAIETLAARGIISGKAEKTFAADATMTRAEFASIIVRGLGLSEKATAVFADVPVNSWYAGAVGSAYSYGIVAGTAPATFNPSGSITREEAAVMVARAAKLTGMEIALTDGEVRDILAQFADYTSASDWARSSLAFCYQEDILSQEDINIRAKAAVKRCEVAEMLFSMLEAAKLL